MKKYFFFEKENLFSEIQKELEQKLDALVARELYTKYKTAPTEEEKEKAAAKAGSVRRAGCPSYACILTKAQVSP